MVILLSAFVLVLSSSFASSTQGFVGNNRSNFRQLPKSSYLFPQSKTLSRSQRRQRRPEPSSTSPTTIAARWSGNDEIEGSNVLRSCIPYILPLVDGDHFGRFIYERIPPLGFLDSVFIGPLAETFESIPFAGLLFFLALTLGTRTNFEMNRNVRFNAQQAALIDVALVIPELVGSIFEGVDVPRFLVEPASNFVYYCYMSAVLYSIFTIVVVRRKPDQIPFISSYSELMTGPL